MIQAALRIITTGASHVWRYRAAYARLANLVLTGLTHFLSKTQDDPAAVLDDLKKNADSPIERLTALPLILHDVGLARDELQAEALAQAAVDATALLLTLPTRIRDAAIADVRAKAPMDHVTYNISTTLEQLSSEA